MILFNPPPGKLPGLQDSALIAGDALQALKAFPDGFFQCCVTSPPYWGLRDYETDNQIGSERTLGDYLDSLCRVMKEVFRTLKPDGTLWLNVGDAYTSGGRKYRAPDRKTDGLSRVRAMAYRPETPKGLKPKDLIGVPWQVAFALQAQGWHLRCDVIWEKPNCLPESVKDRPTRCHEYLFLLSRSENYYYDHDSIMETGTRGRRNRRSVWQVNTRPLKEAHFASFPEELITPCILSGSREGDFVLDPFFGAGTVGVASLGHGRRFVGIEINKEYVELAMNRIERSQAGRVELSDNGQRKGALKAKNDQQDSKRQVRD
jgi:site-specific DNA-methyltransferase (adenine-specific)